jgi:hypothetical protein
MEAVRMEDQIVLNKILLSFGQQLRQYLQDNNRKDTLKSGESEKLEVKIEKIPPS